MDLNEAVAVCQVRCCVGNSDQRTYEAFKIVRSALQSKGLGAHNEANNCEYIARPCSHYDSCPVDTATLRRRLDEALIPRHDSDSKPIGTPGQIDILLDRYFQHMELKHCHHCKAYILPEVCPECKKKV